MTPTGIARSLFMTPCTTSSDSRTTSSALFPTNRHLCVSSYSGYCERKGTMRRVGRRGDLPLTGGSNANEVPARQDDGPALRLDGAR